MVAMKSKFNDQTGTERWSDASYRALAEVWAGQLPRVKEIVPSEVSTQIDNIYPRDEKEMLAKFAAHYGRINFTVEQYSAFVDILADKIKTIPHIKNINCPYEMIELSAYDSYLEEAMKEAGYTGNIVQDNMTKNILPTALNTYLYEDGQILVSSERRVLVSSEKRDIVQINYPDQPDIPYVAFEDIDFTDCPYFRSERRSLIVDLEPDQKFYGVMMRNNKLEYYEEIAEKEQVLVISDDGNAFFDSLTRKDALDLRKHPTITSAYAGKKKDYAEGFGRYNETIQKIDDNGHFRSLSLAFRAKQAETTFMTGIGLDYTTVQPGDYMTETTYDSEYRKIEIVPKARLEGKGVRWLPSTPDGTISEPTKSSKTTNKNNGPT